MAHTKALLKDKFYYEQQRFGNIGIWFRMLVQDCCAVSTVPELHNTRTRIVTPRPPTHLHGKPVYKITRLRIRRFFAHQPSNLFCRVPCLKRIRL